MKSITQRTLFPLILTFFIAKPFVALSDAEIDESTVEKTIVVDPSRAGDFHPPSLRSHE